MNDIDDDWESFLCDGVINNNINDDKNTIKSNRKTSRNNGLNSKKIKSKKSKLSSESNNNVNDNNSEIDNSESDIDNEFNEFLDPSLYDGDDDYDNEDNNQNNNASEENKTKKLHDIAPKCSEIYISTKTKIAYLNKQIDIKSIFWKIPILPYSSPCEGVIKKQIKFSTIDPEEFKTIHENLKNEKYYQVQEIEHIENPEGRIKFKVQLKINVGLCKKDILNYRCKLKRAFFNCFVFIMRIKDDENDVYKEMHVKVFNTGKLEIPGIQNIKMLEKVLNLLINILKPIIGEDLDYSKDNSENVLINSNFNCGYYINRDKLHNILKYKYGINSNYDPCSYPGIQCKFFYVPGLQIQSGRQPQDIDINQCNQISFMIFRTGSVLIVGKCDESVLYCIYDFLKKLLEDEYHLIGNEINVLGSKKHNVKLRKKTIYTEEIHNNDI